MGESGSCRLVRRRQRFKEMRAWYHSETGLHRWGSLLDKYLLARWRYAFANVHVWRLRVGFTGYQNRLPYMMFLRAKKDNMLVSMISRMQLTRCWSIAVFAAFALSGCSDDPATYPFHTGFSFPVDTMQVVWEIGEELGGSSESFGSIVDVVIDHHGRIIVLDRIDCCLKVYDENGAFLQQVSRWGNGPGELMFPQGLFLLSAGGIGVLEPNKWGYITFNDSLQYEAEIGFWMENAPYHVSAITEDRIVVARYDENVREDVLRHTLAIYVFGEPEWETLLWKDSIRVTDNEYEQDPSTTYKFAWLNLHRTCCDNTGNVYFAPFDQQNYTVIGWDSTGREILCISDPVAPVEKTETEIAEEIEFVNAYHFGLSGRGLPFEFHPDQNKNTIRNLGVGPDGNLWVERGTTDQPTFDLITTEGELVGHKLFTLEGRNWEIRVMPQGILAWDLDPLLGYQKLYLIE